MPKKVLYFYPYLSTFIKKDLEILDQEFNIYSKGFHASKKWKALILFIDQFIFIVRHIVKSDIVICRFVGYHSFLPSFLGKILKKPVILIPGGTECHYFPHIKYGNFTKPFYSFFTKASFNKATLIVPVDDSLILSNYTYDDTVPSPQGYKAILKSNDVPVKVIHNGYDESVFYINSTQRTKNSFLTVTGNLIGPDYFVKGIDLIIEVAKLLPEFHFTIIGKHNGIKNLPVNVLIHQAVPHQELVKIYNQHEFYLQMSMAEGFPNTLCEAMLCGCIPIGSNVFSIPKIIEDTGFILQKKDPGLLKHILRTATTADKVNLSKAARKRIIENYPISRRKKELIEAINDQLKNR